MDEKIKQKFKEAKEAIGWHEDIVWDYDTIIKFFSRFNKTGWDEKTIYRFISKIKFPKDLENDCWIWTAVTNSNGYGGFKIKGKMERTHRLMYKFFFKKIPDGLYILHKCDVRNCVNIFHLWSGTHLDNMQDRNNKGRTAKGEQLNNHKGNKQLVYKLFKKIENGEIRNKQDFQLKVKDFSYSHIMNILNGHFRSDVGELFDLEDLKNKISGRFTDDQVREIRIRLRNGESGVSIGRQFNCDASTISQIKNNKIYKHIQI